MGGAESCKEKNIQLEPDPKKFLIPETRPEPVKNLFSNPKSTRFRV